MATIDFSPTAPSIHSTFDPDTGVLGQAGMDVGSRAADFASGSLGPGGLGLTGLDAGYGVAAGPSFGGPFCGAAAGPSSAGSLEAFGGPGAPPIDSFGSPIGFYPEDPGYAAGGLASLPQISQSGLYRAMGRG